VRLNVVHIHPANTAVTVNTGVVGLPTTCFSFGKSKKPVAFTVFLNGSLVTILPRLSGALV
jgi:hypothetical protein